MNRKIKSFFEDFIIVVILITVIYGSYSYIIDDSNDTFDTHQNVVQAVEEAKQEIKEVSQDEVIKDVITDENPDNENNKLLENRVPPALVQSNIEENSSNQAVEEKSIATSEQKNDIATTSKTEHQTTNDIVTSSDKKLKLIENIKLEKAASLEEQTEIEKFYNNLKEKIYTNIESSLDKSSFKEPVFADIRITILKDGRYEQLILTNGNNEFFNSIKNSIYKSFPVEINPVLKNIFPRYYRLKIEFN